MMMRLFRTAVDRCKSQAHFPFSLTSKIFDILHIPYTWYEANDIDFAIDKTNSYLKKHSKSKDDFER